MTVKGWREFQQVCAHRPSTKVQSHLELPGCGTSVGVREVALSACTCSLPAGLALGVGSVEMEDSGTMSLGMAVRL